MILKRLIWFGGNLLFFCLILFLSTCFSQQKKDQHQIGDDGKLLISVQIWGEVGRPGEYLVPDDTDILELISKAGGPSEYANLSKVKITRGLTNLIDLKSNANQRVRSIDKKKFYNKYTKQIIKVDLKKMLDKEKHYETLPILKPGDVVRISSNTWFKWQTIIRVISNLAIVAQVWYWYSRAD